jgi:phage virion morphogenesis protein
VPEPFAQAIERLYQNLQPSSRKRLLQGIAKDVLREQRERIAKQQNPDGSRYAERRIDSRRKDQKRGAMFKKIRLARYTRAKTNGDNITIDFEPRVQRVAKVHQFGEMDSPRKGMHRVKYRIRELLGISDRTERVVSDALTNRLLSI